jgi:hypothetical protein
VRKLEVALCYGFVFILFCNYCSKVMAFFSYSDNVVYTLLLQVMGTAEFPLNITWISTACRSASDFPRPCVIGLW